MAENTEALSDPNYNPTIDPTTLKLLSLMDDPSDDLYNEYKTIFDNLPTTNPFSGVLINPNTCDVQDVQNSITLTTNALNDYVKNNYPSDPTWNYQIIDPSNPDSAVSQLTGGNSTVDPITSAVTFVQPNSALSATNTAQNHTDKLLANLPMILGTVQQALGLATAIGGLLNPCLGMDGFLGSLMGALNKILKAIKAAIAYVMNIIDQGIQAIMAAIKAVMDLVGQLIAFIEAEIQKLIKALIDALRAGLAAFLSMLNLDPCLKSIVSNVTTLSASSLL